MNKCLLQHRQLSSNKAPYDYDNNHTFKDHRGYRYAMYFSGTRNNYFVENIDRHVYRIYCSLSSFYNNFELFLYLFLTVDKCT